MRDSSREASFRPLQTWEGTVLEVREDAMIVRLIDLTAEGPDEEAEIPLARVPRTELDLVEEGAVFYWSIGLHERSEGQRTRASRIRFRRSPVWTAADLEEGRRWAEDMLRGFDGE